MKRKQSGTILLDMLIICYDEGGEILVTEAIGPGPPDVEKANR